MLDTEFIAKTINDGNTDLPQYPAAKLQHMAKKLKSNKATANHIKQHTSNMQGGAQVNALRHNDTSLHPRRKYVVRNQTQLKGINCSSEGS